MDELPLPTTPSRFTDLGLSAALCKVLGELGYDSPTAIQAAAIPLLVAGRDVIGQSRTGSGKTAAFAIPLLERIEATRADLQALVICPTRDLCTQVADEIRKLGRYQPHLRVVVVTGGKPIGPQVLTLQRKSHVVVGTPGRLLDHLSRGTLDVGHLSMIVLDEADRMLDMGFHEDVATILEQTPATRQTALFSATFPAEILELSTRYQRNPEHLSVASVTTPVEQWRWECDESGRTDALLAVLAGLSAQHVLIFCNTKQSVDDLTNALRARGFAANRLHGGMEQHERDAALAQFRNRSTRVLVATDVAARGLDITGLDAVINYELPDQPELYVHRIGRTGRANRAGTAISLYNSNQTPRLVDFETYTGTPIRTWRAAAAPTQSPLDAPLRTICIGGGRKDKLRPGDILGALTGAAGLTADEVGRIEITDRLSYVAVAADAAPRTVSRLRQDKIKGRRFRIELLS